MSDDIHIDTVWPGRAYPRGATWDGHGVNFAVFSEHADKVELCLFDARGRERQRIAMPDRTDHVWHAYLPQARPGMTYGYRMHGPYRPQDGHRFNANKLLIDPYAKDYAGALRWNDALYGYTIGHKKADLSFDKRDSAPYMPKARVIDAAFSWGDDRRPDIPWNEMVVYELHVRGFTMQHPQVPEALRGTYAGLSTAPAIDHLKRLGITTVELMPVHAFINDSYLADKQLQNYWGYNSLGFFVPEPRYSHSHNIREFKTLVRSLHAAGIEVILDVVYNHTCEGSHLGPTLSFRGIDNAAYYVLAEDKRYYDDVTGCGNTVNMPHPRALQMVMDSLRYWVDEMHVDGFRFDLASALAREGGRGVDQLGGFFDAVRQDPTLNGVKLIAEPWDLGQGGYQVGNFPLGWAEWNDRYRDGMRAYWKGDAGMLGDFASRLTGSSDIYGRSGKRPNAGVNFIAAHDGFTLHDLVSYNDKHNDANGEDNRDGHNHNLSWNCGAEGPTDDAAINALREQQKRNLLATLLLSQGVPMLLAGDEMGRTQGGNNNAYAQDNPISWLDWAPSPERDALTAFTAKLVALRRKHPTFRRRDFFAGLSDSGHDVRWLHPEGRDMTDGDWHQDHARCLGVYLAGGHLAEMDSRGRRLVDDDFLLLFNAHHEDVPFTLPAWDQRPWNCCFDTAADAPEVRLPFKGASVFPLRARSVAVLVRAVEPA